MKAKWKKISVTIIVIIILLIPFYIIFMSVGIKNDFKDNGFKPVNVGKTSLVSYYEKEGETNFDSTNYNFGFHVAKGGMLNPFEYVASFNIYNQEDQFENYNLFVEYKRKQIRYYSFSVQNGSETSDTCPIDIDTMEFEPTAPYYMESCSTEQYQVLLDENKDFLSWCFGIILDELSFLN